MLYYITLIAASIVALVFSIVRAKGASVNNLYFKMISSLCFMLIAVVGVIQNPDASLLGVLIIMGGALGLSGDVALDLKYVYLKDSHPHLIAGFLFFLVGHVFYNAAIILFASLDWIKVLICVAISVVLSFITVQSGKLLKIEYGKYKLIALLYGLSLVMTTCTSVTAYVITQSKAMLIFAIGAVMFLISDLILSKIYFAKDSVKPVPVCLNHIFYYGGQIAIAASVVFLNA